MYQKALLTFSIFITAFASNAQWPLTKANKLFYQSAFADAAYYYEVVLQKDSVNSQALHNICQSLLLINDYTNAEKYYAKVVTLSDVLPIEYYNYARVLLSNNKPDLAKKYFEQYLIKNSEDPRGTNYFEGLKTSPPSQSSAFKIDRLSFNTDRPEFSPVLYNNSIVYVTENTSFSMVSHAHSWTDKPFLTLVSRNLDNKSDSKSFIPKQDSKYNVGPVCFTSAFGEMYATENSVEGYDLNSKLIKLKIYHYTNSNGSWQRADEFPFNSNDINTAHPALNADNTILYFSSDRPGGYGGMDIWRSKKINGKWSTPVNMGSIVNTKGNETFPYISSKDILYFSSDGQYSFGGLDIFSVRVNSDSTDKSISHLPLPINSKDDDFGIIYNDDNESGYFSSNRAKRGIDDDIYSFKALCKPFAGQIIDNKTQQPLSEAMVVLFYDNRAVDVFKTDADGSFSFCLTDDRNYIVQVTKEPYNIFKSDMNSLKTEMALTKKPASISLNKDEIINYKISGLVYESSTKNPIVGQKISLLEMNGEKIEDVLTDEKGIYTFGNLLKDTDYQVELIREKCGTTTLKKTTRNIQGATEITADFPVFCEGFVIKIDNIYYDLGKYNIRTDAGKELDKLIDILNQYPSMTIELRSHTDSRGSDQSNMTLSQNRAQSAVKYIVSKGINQSRMIAKGYGETDLLNSCANGIKCSEEEHQLNRRTEFKILSIK